MEEYYTKADKTRLKAMFQNDEDIKLMRKIFAPAYDSSSPINNNGTLINTININENSSAEDIAIETKSTMKLIGHIEGCLNQLKVLSTQEEVTKEEIDRKIEEDSSK